MKKSSVIFFLLTSFCISLLAQQEYMSEGFEVFNAATKLPEGWIVYTKEGTRPFSVVKDSKFGVPQARTEKCYITTTSNPPRYDDPKIRRDNWLVSPKLKYTTGATVSLWAKSKDAPGSLSVPEEDPNSRFAIYLSKTGTAVADFTVLLLEAVQVPNSYTEYAVDLSSPAFGLTAGDEVCIAIRVIDEVDLSTSPNTNRILYIDDIEFGVPVTNPIVELSGAAWAAQTMVGESVSSGNVFNLKNVGGGQLKVTTVTSLDGTFFTTTFSKDAVILSQNQSYTFSFNYSSDSPISITKDFVIETTGGSVTVTLSGITEPLPVPFNEINEDFDDGLPSNWLTIDGNNDKNCWTIKNGALVLELNAVAQNDWIVLPRIKVREGHVLSFDYKCSLSDKGVINIKASKQGRAIENFSITLAENLVVPHNPIDFITKQIDIVGSSLVDGDEVFIAIQCVSDPVGGVFPGKLTIDNVKVVAPSRKAEIVSCTVIGQVASVINAEVGTVNITVPTSVDLTKVSPVINVSDKASVVPASGTEQNFSQGAVTYTVTAEAGNTRVWQVSVVQEEQSIEGIFEGFEGGELPAAWRMVDADNDGKAWFVIKYMPFEGDYIIKTKRNKKQNNDWLIAPRVKVRENDVLSFMYRSSAVNYKESFNVKVSKDGVNVDNDFTITLASVIDASADVGFTKFEYKLCDNDNIAAGDEVYIAIQVVSADKGELHVDNFSVAPPATNPKLLMQGDHWRSVVEANQKATSPEVFALTNTLAGELTVLSVELPQGFTTSLNPSAVSLTKDEVYSFTISFEPETAGDYFGSMVIKTNGGDAVIDLKGYAYASGLYHEGFESEAAINAWEVIDADADGLGWFPYQNNEYAPDLAHSGMGCVVSESAKLSGGPATPNNWLVSPKVVVSSGSSLTFWVGAVSDISFREHYSVLLSTKGKGLDNFDVVLVDNEELASHAWVKRSIDLSAYANKSVYIAFVHHKVSDQSQILIDDVVLPAKHVATNPDLTVLLKQLNYTICPLSQAVYNFDAKVKNQGAALTEATSLTFTVAETSYKELISIPVPLAASSEVVLAVSNGFMPKIKGEYTVRVEAAIANDENPADNVITSTFTVCDSVLARDKGIFTNFVGLGPKNGGVVGQKFALVAKDNLTSISFYRVAASTELTVSASVFGFDTKPTNEIARTANITIPAEFEGWVTIPLAKPLMLEPNAYFIGLNESVEGNLGLAVDQGIFHPQSCFIQYMGEWIAADELEETMQMALLLRANFAPEKIISSDYYNKLNVSVHPNPAKDCITIEGMSGSSATFYSLSGTVCKSVSIESDTQKVNIQQLQPGVYVLRIAKQNLQSSIKLVVTR